MAAISDFEIEQINKANATKKPPVMFVHGLWLLPSSWDRWRALFDKAGYASLAPGWPDDPNTVEEANAMVRRREIVDMKTAYGLTLL